MKYAEGFTLDSVGEFQRITIQTPYKNATKPLQYLLVPKGVQIPKHDKNIQIVRVPVEKIVVTSTSHVPLLELLHVENTLVGFPNTDFISSEKTRALVSNGHVKDLGQTEQINTEILLDLAPELVMSFAVDKPNKSFEQIKKTGIPILLNGDWLEKDPLGRAEWIKLYGAIYQKQWIADSIFKSIEVSYNSAKEIAKNATDKPTVLSGSIFQDVWYTPAGESFMARYFKDAQTDYLWKDTKGGGSLSLNFENVLEKAAHADFWLGCSVFQSKIEMRNASAHYLQFDAFNNHTYTYASHRGATNGMLYFELGPIRPDIILKDIIKITHPELLPDHKLFFFEKLK